MDSVPIVHSTVIEPSTISSPLEPCIIVFFGACGNLMNRMLLPAIYNLACDKLLPDQFAMVGADFKELSTEQFLKTFLDEENSIKQYLNKDFSSTVWDWMQSRLVYVNMLQSDAYQKLAKEINALDEKYKTCGNILFYYAVPPTEFATISTKLYENGFKQGNGWRRFLIEKPFGHDLPSAQALNREMLSYWDESQIYRVDHYLGKETVQNILIFRFANELFEPVWNKEHIDHIQLTVSESMDIGNRGYYDQVGILRDMIQNHMLQMLSYLTMEPPISFSAEDIRNEKAKVLKAIRLYTPEEALQNSARGQYGAGTKPDGSVIFPYRENPSVIEARNKRGLLTHSTTETFAALRLFIDNWRWKGVPIFLRSGKALWKHDTDITIQFKKPPDILFKGTTITELPANRITFHIQPDQSIESFFSAKIPGPGISLQSVDMRFAYSDTFKVSHNTGYELMIYSCLANDQTLFSRFDMIELAWRIVQPFIDSWEQKPPMNFPNYAAGSWGPKAASDLIAMDGGRYWFEVITNESLERVPLFKGSDPLFLNRVSLALQSKSYAAGETIIRKGDVGAEMYLICRGQVEVFEIDDIVKATLKEGDCFGETALLLKVPRNATVKAKTLCNLFVLEKKDFNRILSDHPQFHQAIQKIAKERYKF